MYRKTSARARAGSVNVRAHTVAQLTRKREEKEWRQRRGEGGGEVGRNKKKKEEAKEIMTLRGSRARVDTANRVGR